MNTIPIDTVGRILLGDDAGSFVKVLDDSANSGGFLILQSKSETFSKGEIFDDWVEDFQSLKTYFQESKWLIEWRPYKSS